MFKSNFHRTSFKCWFKFHGMPCWLWIESVPCKPLAEVVRWGLDLSLCHTTNQFWHWTVNFRKIELVYNFILITWAHVLFENRKALLVLWSCGWRLIESVRQSSKPIWQPTTSLPRQQHKLGSQNPKLEILTKFRRNQFLSAALSLPRSTTGLPFDSLTDFDCFHRISLFYTTRMSSWASMGN